jgi:hypothetical protein
MCYLNVEAPITTENDIDPFVIAKRTWKSFFSFNLKVAKFKYEKAIDSNFSETFNIVILLD